MKINNLEKKDFSEKIDWDRAFPKKSSPDFLERVYQNWQNLERAELNKKGDTAFRLYREFKPDKGRINKSTIFYLWLYLCLNRSWERNEKITFSEKRGEKTACHEKCWSDEVGKVLGQLEIRFPYNLQIQTLRKYTNRKDFKSVIAWTATDPGISIVIGKIFIEGAKAFKKMAEGFKNKQIDFNNLKLNFRFANYIRLQKYVKKRNLMRTLGINKEKCDLLLTEAESQGFIKTLRYPHNSIWIIHIKHRKRPISKHSASIDTRN